MLDDLDQVLRDSVSSPGYSLQRVAGVDRYATAAAAAGVAGGSSVGAYAAAGDQAPARTAFLSNGLTPVDSLSAGPGAYRSHFPVLLTRRDCVPATTLAALAREGISNVLLLGGTGAVSESAVA